MAEPKFAIDGKLGVDITASDTSAEFPGGQFRLGTTAPSAANNVLIYVFANTALASGTGCEMGASFTASATSGGEYTAIYAIASGEYGWVERTFTVIQS